MQAASGPRLFIAILQSIPPPDHVVPAGDVLVAFEQEHFPPGTDANNLYQIAIFTWNDVIFSATIFPREYLARCDAAMRPVGLTLTRGAPTAGEESLLVHQYLPSWLGPLVGETYVYRQSAAAPPGE